MPEKPQHPEAEEAAEAIAEYFGWSHMSKIFIPSLARIITEKMAPAIEAGYREGWGHGTIARAVFSDADGAWLHSKAFAALAGKEGG